MDALDVSGAPHYMEVVNQQRKVLQDAQAHKGESPEETDRNKLVIDLLVSGVANARQNRTTNGVKLQVAFLPPPYLPSTTPLSSLRKVMIKDLVLETHHWGTYVVLKAVVPSIRLVAVLAVVEDEEDRAVVLQLYHQDSSCCPNHILDSDDVVIVKEPYLKRDADGRVTIRVDHVSDVIFLHKFDERVPEVWRQSTKEHDDSEDKHDEKVPEARRQSTTEPDNCGDKNDEQCGPWCEIKLDDHCVIKHDDNCKVKRRVDTWMMRGDDFFKKKKDQFAIDCYSKGLQSSPDQAQTRHLCFVRALGYLRVNNFTDALLDLKHPLITRDPDGTSLKCTARALYGLEQYRECCRLYRTIIQEKEKYSVEVSVNKQLTAAIRRVAEQEKGQYKFLEMQSEALSIVPPLLNHATYASSLCIRDVEYRGRGLFTKTAVKAGDLLLCEKALGYAFIDSGVKPGEMSLLINTVTDVMALGKQVELLSQLIRKVHSNPELLPVLTDLCHGSYEPAGVDIVDGAPVVDTFLIERIVALNAFGVPTSARERHHPVRCPSYLTHNGHFSCGIWPISSYINHSCYSNARRGIIGDMMIIRASQDLEPGTEITMWYKPFAQKGSKEDLPSFSHWGFECKCLFCEDVRSTHKDTLAKRKGLTTRVHRYLNDGINANPMNIERVLNAVDDTYTKSSTEVPHLNVWDPALSLSALYAERQQPIKVIEWVLKAFEALGFVIEGGAVPRASDAPLVIKKWGMMEDQLVRGWIVLTRAYRIVAPELEPAAIGYAKLCYRICVGEDETFEETYGRALA